MVTKVTLHGELGQVFGEHFNLAVNSFSEAIHAINVKSKSQLYPWLFNKDKTGVKYKIIINGEDFKSDEDLTVLNQKAVESVLVSDLTIKRKLRTIDIVPVLEGADADTLGIITLVLGVILIATGIFSPAGFTLLGLSQGTLVLVGIALLAGGIISLLSQGPEFQDFREISNSGRTSYLFSGPQNTVGEGGPVPVGYGRLIVGSQTVAASYRVKNIDAGAVTGPLDELGQIVSNEIYNLITSNEISPGAPVSAISFGSNGEFYFSATVTTFLPGQAHSGLAQNEIKNILYTISLEFKVANSVAFSQSVFYPTFDQPKPPTLFRVLDLTDNSEVIVGDGSSSLGLTSPRGISSAAVFNGFYPKTYKIPTNPQASPIFNYGFNAKVNCVLKIASQNYFLGGNFTTFTWENSIISSSLPKFLKISESNGTFSVAAGWAPGTTVISSGNVYCAALQGDGKILIGGDFTITDGVDTSYLAARLNSDGTLDATFAAFNVGDAGIVYSIKIESTGKILLGGSFPTVGGNATYAKFCRVSATGNQEDALSSLSGGLAEVRTIAVQSLDNKIIIGGSFTDAGGYGRNSIARVDSTTFLIDPTLDYNSVFATHSFNAPGPNQINIIKVRDNFSYQGADGKIYIGTEYPIPDVRRLTTPGSYGGLIILNNDGYIG